MLLPLLFIACLGAQDAPDATPFRVMSFNLRYGTADDGANSWGYRKDILVDTIKKHDPDIVGTQECLEFQANYIVEKLPDYAWFGIGRERDGQGERTAILYKKKALVPIETGNFWLSEEPDTPGSKSWDSALPRIATWARMWHPESSTYFYFVNTHFDHRGSEARANAATLIADRVALLPDSMPVIVTGDFNAAAESSDPWENATASGLRDTWLDAAETAGVKYTFGGFRPLDETKEGRIDWILVRGPITVQRSEVITDNLDGRFPSDHFPVFATLQFTPAPQD